MVDISGLRREVMIGNLLALLAAGCFAASGTFIKLYYAADGQPQTLMLLRVAGAALAFTLVCIARRQALPKGRLLVAGLALGLCQLTLVLSLYEGLALAPVALVIVLFYIYPLLVVIGARVVFKEALGFGRVLILLLGSAGIVLVIGAPTSFSALGAVLGLAAGASNAAAVLGGKALLSKAVSVTELTAVIYILPACLFTAFALVHGVPPLTNAAAILSSVAVVVIGTILPVLFFYSAIALIGPVRASLIATAEPVLAAAFAFMVLGEALTPVQYVGGALVVVAVVALNVASLRQPQPADAAAVAASGS